MLQKPLSEIVEADIQELKETGVSEGTRLEYKRELPGTRDEDKREFLADVSSFANTEGGDVIYGVDEEQGVITNILGVTSPDLDAETLRLEGLIRDGISPRMSIALNFLRTSVGKLLIIRVEKSWIGPHRVVFRGHDKFYARTSAGKFPLDVNQLRTAFVQSGTLSEKIMGFRIDRIIDIANDRAPLPLEQSPTVVLHVIPFVALSGETQFDATAFLKNPFLHRTWGASGSSSRMTFEGAILHTYTDDNGRVSSYTHFFRNGILEAATTLLLEFKVTPEKRLIPNLSLEGEVLKYVPACFQSLQSLGVRPPVSLSLTLLRVKGLRMATNAFERDSGNSIREETLIIPGVMVQDFSDPVGPLLKPMFDRIWNACGLLESPNFDAQGNWIGRLQF